MIIPGDCLDVLKTLEPDSVDCCVTSPPYWGLRNYGVEGQLGLEKTPEEYTAKMVAVFQEVKRVLKPQGTLWLNLGDCYVGANNTNNGGNANFGSQPGREGIGKCPKALWGGLLPKNLVGIPWRVAFALQADGWYLRQDIIWHKPNPMPESVTDRCTKAHEYIFLLAKSARYYYDAEAVKEKSVDIESIEGRNWRDLRTCDKTNDPKLKQNFYKLEGKKYPTRNLRSVWTITTHGFPEAHFATFPEALVGPMIKAGCPEGGIVLDPFNGAGTTGVVAIKLGRKYIGIELNREYIAMSERRIAEAQMEYDYKQNQGQFWESKA